MSDYCFECEEEFDTEDGNTCCPSCGHEGASARSDRLEAALAAERARADKAEAALAEEEAHRVHAEEWYAVRFEVLKDWARKNDHNEVFNILANGVPNITDPPTYAQQMNILKHKLDAAEAALAESRREVERLWACIAALTIGEGDPHHCRMCDAVTARDLPALCAALGVETEKEVSHG